MPEIATLPRLLKELRLPAIARQCQAVEKSASRAPLDARTVLGGPVRAGTRPPP